MCLEITKNPAKSNRVEVYKVVQQKGRRYYTPYQARPIKEGLFKSNRTSAEISQEEIENGAIELGVHVYTRLDLAMTESLCFHYKTMYFLPLYYFKVFRCTVDPADHVADSADGTEAVYTQIEVKECV